MRRILYSGIVAGLLLALLIGCGRQGEPGGASGDHNISAPLSSSASGGQEQNPSAAAGEQEEPDLGKISREEALAIALANAGVPEEDARNIKNETDEDNGVPIYDIEFETDYGDYDFEVSIADGRIVVADYEVDEEWLDVLGGSPISLDEAADIVQSKVPGSDAADIKVWEESGDGRARYEGELFFDGMKYEFEIDPHTGVLFEWNADLRD